LFPWWVNAAFQLYCAALCILVARPLRSWRERLLFGFIGLTFCVGAVQPLLPDRTTLAANSVTLALWAGTFLGGLGMLIGMARAPSEPERPETESRG